MFNRDHDRNRKASAYSQIGVLGSSPDLPEEPRGVREPTTLSGIIQAGIHVSENIAEVQKQAWSLAEQVEAMVERIAGPSNTTKGLSAAPASGENVAIRPDAMIDVLHAAMTGLNPQVNAIRSPLHRISSALDRLDLALR